MSKYFDQPRYTGITKHKFVERVIVILKKNY